MLTPASRRGFNLDLVVAVRSLLQWSVRGQREVMESLVWPYTQYLLDQYAASQPVALRAFHELPELTGAQSVQVNLLLHDGRAVWLGKIVTKSCVFDAWEIEVAVARADQDTEALARLEAEGPEIVRRDVTGCLIPVGVNTLTEASLADGIRAYLRAFCPALADVSIEWIDHETSRALTNELQYRITGRRVRS